MKVGIVCDNYKVKQFKQKLDEKKFIYTDMPFNILLKLTLIKIVAEKERLQEIADICLSLEIKFDLKNHNN